MTTAAATDEVRDYLAEVAARLERLPAADRAELLDDLEQHLLEVAAETGASLHERLGPPDAYAAELLTSAGFDDAHDTAAAPEPPPPTPLAVRLLDTARRIPWAEARDALSAHRPVWWVLRGYVVGWMLADLLTSDELRSGWLVFPSIEHDSLKGFAVAVACIAASVFIARAAKARRSSRVLVTVGNVVVLLFALSLAGKASGRSIDRTYYQQGGISPCMRASDGSYVRNIYAYDADGNPLDAVLLYDEHGRPLDSVCSPFGVHLDDHGSAVTNAYPRPAPSVYVGRVTLDKAPPPAITPPRLAAPTTTTAPTTP